MKKPLKIKVSTSYHLKVPSPKVSHDHYTRFPKLHVINQNYFMSNLHIFEPQLTIVVFEFTLENMNIYLHLIHNLEMTQVVEIFPCGRQGRTHLSFYPITYPFHRKGKTIWFSMSFQDSSLKTYLGNLVYSPNAFKRPVTSPLATHSPSPPSDWSVSSAPLGWSPPLGGIASSAANNCHQGHDKSSIAYTDARQWTEQHVSP